MTAVTVPYHSRVRRVGRATVSAGLVVAGLTAMVANGGFRSLEAMVGAAISGAVTGSETLTVGSRHAFYWLAGTPDMRGLQVTPQCTAAFIVGPILLVAGAVAWSRRLRLSRLVAATGVSLALVVAMVAARLGLIVWSVHEFGPEAGYRWSHTIGGSLVSMVGVIVALVVFVRIAFREQPKGT